VSHDAHEKEKLNCEMVLMQFSHDFRPTSLSGAEKQRDDNGRRERFVDEMQMIFFLYIFVASYIRPNLT
jgi:hypothetical protein